MDREILFRGKRMDNGKWVEGNLLRTDDDGTCIIQNHVPHHLLKNYEVDPKTVCQYTGLIDRDGRKIFEGDIVSIPGKKNHNVKFEYGQFCIGLNWPIAYSRRECEVIGNIFDNPDFLEGGAE